ncbi:MAG TPA: hypothetical protein VH063_00190 [Gaiellaceae bacterium]|jgi:hypothetical protein|nr:hypothetical protein [Gaiellaceae bacterium]
MSRDRERAPGKRPQDTPARPGDRAAHPVLALQQVAGNRAVGQILAREAAPASKGATIQLGKLLIDVAAGNIAAWAASDVPDTLDVTSQKGPHSAELERLSTEHARVDSLTLTVAAANKSGQELDLGSLAIEITNSHIKGYKLDGAAETWQVRDFDAVHRKKTSHKVS